MKILDKKIVVVDENLSKITGMETGSLASYTEIAKGIYEYIKSNDLIREERKKIVKRFCFKCGASLPRKAKYCDRCGTKL